MTHLFSSRIATGMAVVLISATAFVIAGPSAGADIVIDGCTIVSSPTPSTHTVCPGADLSDADLDGVDLSYADLDHADLQNASLQQDLVSGDLTNLTGADVEFADFRGAVLGGPFTPTTDAEHAVLTGDRFLYGCLCGDFTDAQMSGLVANEDGSDPIQIAGTFDGADLSNVSFGDTSFSGSFLGANLQGTSIISGVHGGLSDANFTGADLTDATVRSTSAVRNIDFTAADVRGIVLHGDFIGTTLTGSTWYGGNMLPLNQTVQSTNGFDASASWPDPSGPAGVEIGLDTACDHASGDLFPVGTTTVHCTVSAPDTGTSGTGTFTISVVTDVTIDGCLIVAQPTPSHHTSCAGDDLSNIDLKDFDLSYADLHGANLTNADLTGAELVGADLSNATIAQVVLQGTNLDGASLTGLDLTTASGSANFSHTILAVTDRTYPATQSDGRVLGWQKPPGYAAVTGATPRGCSPVTSSLFPVGTTTVHCEVTHTDANHTLLGTFTFTETVLPVVEPGSGVVTAPTSGTADLAVTVSLNAPLPTTVTVPWTTRFVGGAPTLFGALQAPAGDYTASSGTITFTAGQTTAVVHIPVTGDSTGGVEFIVVSFHNPTGAEVGGFYGLGFGIIDQP